MLDYLRAAGHWGGGRRSLTLRDSLLCCGLDSGAMDLCGDHGPGAIQSGAGHDFADADGVGERAGGGMVDGLGDFDRTLFACGSGDRGDGVSRVAGGVGGEGLAVGGGRIPRVVGGAIVPGGLCGDLLGD